MKRREKGSMTLAILLLLVGTLMFGGWAITRVVLSIQFDRSIGGHLKRAADANTVELAEKELQTSLDAMKAWHLTDGYTSIVYTTPDEDVNFWYTNVSASLADLQALSPDASGLERSNMLIKLRETLLDHNSNGESVTVPDGISIHPNNREFALLGTLGAFLLILGVLAFCSDDSW